MFVVIFMPQLLSWIRDHDYYFSWRIFCSLQQRLDLTDHTWSPELLAVHVLHRSTKGKIDSLAKIGFYIRVIYVGMKLSQYHFESM